MRRNAETLTSDRLRELLSYDSETGTFSWLKYQGQAKAGKQAGILRKSGRLITIDGRAYPAARLAWLWVHGGFPKRILRFKDGNKDNAKIDNLGFGRFDFTTQEGKTAYQRTWYRANPRSQRKNILRTKFGMEISEYQAMLVEQKGVCAICSQPETETQKGKLLHLSVDHDHGDHSIRGLLCSKCNKGIGLLRDDRILLMNAVGYLDRHASKPKTNIIPLSARRTANSKGE